MKIDIPVVKIDLGYLPPVPGDMGKARFFLRPSKTEDEVFLGKAEEIGSAMLLAGDYHLIYRMEALGSETPRNDGAALACYSLVAP